MICQATINLSATDWVIISAMATTIIALAVYIIKTDQIRRVEAKDRDKILQQTHEVHRIEQKENLTTMITAMAGSTKALENNTKVMDEMKGLINSVRDEIMTRK